MEGFPVGTQASASSAAASVGASSSNAPAAPAAAAGGTSTSSSSSMSFKATMKSMLGFSGQRSSVQTNGSPPEGLLDTSKMSRGAAKGNYLMNASNFSRAMAGGGTWFGGRSKKKAGCDATSLLPESEGSGQPSQEAAAPPPMPEMDDADDVSVSVEIQDPAVPDHDKAEDDADSVPVDRAAVQTFCAYYGCLLMRWPSSAGLYSVGRGLLDTLAFSTAVVPRLWLFLQTELEPSLDTLVKKSSLIHGQDNGSFYAIAVFAATYSHLLNVLDEFEMYDDQKPLPLFQLRRMIRSFKVLLFRGLWGASQLPVAQAVTTDMSEEGFHQNVIRAVTRAMRALYDRSSRRPVGMPDVWLVPELEGLWKAKDFLEQSPAAKRLLASMPYAFPYVDRMRLFQRLVGDQRKSCQPEAARAVRLNIRRGYVLEDGFEQLMRSRPSELRMRHSVIYTNEHGLSEAGMDLGGLFKDFWTDLSAQAFNPGYGLFNTTSEQLLYPNPNSRIIHGSQQHLSLYTFMGRVVGKALFENITVQPKFAHFFLSKLLGHINHLNDLPSLDEELYKNLMFLKSYDGDVEDLCLTFTVTETAYGQTKEVPLLVGGADMPVTNKNRLRYIHMVADFHLNRQMKAQSDAFLGGLLDLIPAQWLHMFNEPELQVLISGSVAPIDVEELRRNTRLAGGFMTMADKSVDRFFRCMQEFDGLERAQLLAFVTGCSRPPSLGFEAMDPPFTLQRVPLSGDEDRLPTASTCFNALKLPTYSSQKVMKQRLLTAIQSGAGFDLT
eukprot:TRINITY_DN19605_c0_g1_i3.p1 TRINITY_DN19605_c0_g1~~TRINITY_DN19605_c0_g1_i3.p1  ORF type:complete len:776 (-),score=174.36 TRINITY_DN19605_c0_g1_i3:76-2403(-)